MPVDEVLAYVQGAVASSSRINGDTRNGRSKRKDTVCNMPRVRKGAPNTDSELAEEKLEIIPQDVVDREDDTSLEAKLQDRKSTLSIVPQKSSSPPANGLISASQQMDAWLSSEMAKHLTLHDDFNDYDLEQRKEREFVTVCKKKKQKMSTLPNAPINKMLLPADQLLELAQRVGSKRKTFNHVDGIVQRILHSGEIAVSRNSSELSFSHSVESDIDDLSHFVGEYLDNAAGSGCEILVDAPVHWYDAREESASNSSCRSSISSYDSLRGLDANDCSMSKNLRNGSVDGDAETDISVRGVPDGDEQVSDFESNQISDRQRRFNGKHLTIEENHLCLQHMMSTTLPDVTENAVCVCESLSLPLNELERSRPAGLSSSQKDASAKAVVFFDSVTVSWLPYSYTSDLTFTYGCILSEHLVDGGLCMGCGCPFVNSICGFERLTVVDFHQTWHESIHSEDGFTIELNQLNGEFNFVFNGLLSEDLIKPKDLPTIEKTCVIHKSSSTASFKTSPFCAKEATIFLNKAFDEVWENMLSGRNGVVMYSTT